MRLSSTAKIVVPIVGILVVLGACRSVVQVVEREGNAEEPSDTIRQRVVVVVHGDASYLYHGRDGTAHQADEETLREVFAAARGMEGAEVLVFHQRSASRLLGLVPRDDGTFYHFRGGRLQHQTTYDQNRDQTLAAEAALVRAHQGPTPDSSFFTAALYYGHAVPERPRPGYHRSRADVRFGIDNLARGFGRMTEPDSAAFDAFVLSTCDGGTPSRVAALAPHAHSLLAAPGDLHLSFIDADLLPAIADATEGGGWTQRLAQRAFDRLVGRVTTAVTLAAYDLDRAAPAARRMAQQVVPDTSTATTGGRHVDCRDVLGPAVDTTGVRVWHRPARFGPGADQTAHSGWGCLRSGFAHRETGSEVP